MSQWEGPPPATLTITLNRLAHGHKAGLREPRDSLPTQWARPTFPKKPPRKLSPRLRWSHRLPLLAFLRPSLSLNLESSLYTTSSSGQLDRKPAWLWALWAPLFTWVSPFGSSCRVSRTRDPRPGARFCLPDTLLVEEGDRNKTCP